MGPAAAYDPAPRPVSVSPPTYPMKRLRRLSGAFAGLLWMAILGITGCRSVAPEWVRYAFTQGKMGTEFRIVLYAPDSAQAVSAANAAFARVDELNDRLSDYLPDSELNRLSRTAGLDSLVPVSDDLWRVLTASADIARQTGGAFDPTVGRLTRLWRRAMRRNVLPTPSEIDSALRTVGYAALHFDPESQRVQLGTPGMRLDLGGIAKGYAADEALAVLSRHGYPSAMVDAGGDVALGSPPPGTAGWRIAVPSTDTTGVPVTEVILATHAALATSGDTYRFMTVDSVRYSHILDPATGLGLTHHRIVTVAAPSGMLADALASAFSVLEAGRRDTLSLPYGQIHWTILEPSEGRLALHRSAAWPFGTLEIHRETGRPD